MKPVGCDYVGVQPSPATPGKGIYLYLLRERVGMHPAGSVVSAETLDALGYYPEIVTYRGKDAA